MGVAQDDLTVNINLLKGTTSHLVVPSGLVHFFIGRYSHPVKQKAGILNLIQIVGNGQFAAVI